MVLSCCRLPCLKLIFCFFLLPSNSFRLGSLSSRISSKLKISPPSAPQTVTMMERVYPAATSLVSNRYVSMLTRSPVLELLLTPVVTASVVRGAELLSTHQKKNHLANIKRELAKEQSYQIDLYIEAVRSLVKELKEVKSSTYEARLQAKLRGIDPYGVLERFVKGKGPRPTSIDQISTPHTPSYTAYANKPLSQQHRSTVDNNFNGFIDSDARQKEGISSPAVIGDHVPSELEDVDGVMETLRSGLVSASISATMDTRTSSSVLSARDIDGLITYIRDRLISISDLTERKKLMDFVLSKVDDTEMWVAYSKQLIQR